ncbi:hypothetical protein QP968_06635 [Corynebacterium sp. MSK041]|uniref:hypothetical protein n=1 Tax=Corynebacterium sp. MSK041 TaxID=3050194 RepID=UPI00254C9747|nr:hypothetical protein [Corynebacterium sp. MSK041]MDK8795388.1 hypothetical protein [Corynebacterium sp. MSK041]
MRKAKTIATVLAATALTVAGCSGNAENGEGEPNTTQNSAVRSDADASATQDQADPGTCAAEVSIKALLEEMPDELVGLPYDPDYSTVMDEGWNHYYQNGPEQFSVGVSYYDEELGQDPCPSDPKKAAQDERKLHMESYQEQQKRDGEAVLPWDEFEFTVGDRSFACAKHPEADLRQFFCSTSFGNAAATTYMFRHSQGDSQDVEDMKEAMAELTPLLDKQPVGPGLSDLN